MIAALLALCCAPAGGDLVPREWLAIEAVDLPGRRPFRPDAVFGACVITGAEPDTTRVWRGESGAERSFAPCAADEQGALPCEFAWAWTRVESPSERVVLAQLTGAARGFVNGDAFMGDPYGYGWPGVPVLLKQGVNQVWIAAPRGRASLRFVEPQGEILLGAWDLTKPDLVAGANRQRNAPRAGVLLVNTTTRPIAPRILEAVGEPPRVAPISRALQLAPIAPLSLAKVAVPLWGLEQAPRAPGTVRFSFAIDTGRERTMHGFDVAVRAADAPRLATYESGIDGSIQVCGILPPKPSADGALDRDPRTLLSLHGASVDAWGQITSYSAKNGWLHIAATNRRPYGFDWQDWGRIDAYEALAAGLREHRGQPAAMMAAPRATCCDARVYLSGHSMGGHGTWHLAANDPDRFLAIAPSAGWVGFDSYPSRPDGELRALWHAADGASDTLASIDNLKQLPAYVVHGTADDNVPVEHARTMIDALTAAGAPPRSHLQEGAGHWWDGGAAAGADCLEWPGIFELFESLDRRETPRELHWRGVDPSVDSTHEWIEVRQLLRYGEDFRVDARVADDGALSITTKNVRRLRLGGLLPGWNGSLAIDGQAIAAFDTRHYARLDGMWRAVDADLDTQAGEKTPDRSGPFKRAFDNWFVMVVGTAGDAAEDALLAARARHDLQAWWYRGNGSCEIVSDTQLLAQEAKYAGRNLVLYGNADTNAAWSRLCAGSPLEARRGSIKLSGDGAAREWTGDALGAVFVRPCTLAAGGKQLRSLVAVFADSGLRGARSGWNLAPFVSGVGYPDYAVWGDEVHAKGDGGVLAAGWFDAQWRLDGRGFLRQ